MPSDDVVGASFRVESDQIKRHRAELPIAATLHEQDFIVVWHFAFKIPWIKLKKKKEKQITREGQTKLFDSV